MLLGTRFTLLEGMVLRKALQQFIRLFLKFNLVPDLQSKCFSDDDFHIFKPLRKWKGGGLKWQLLESPRPLIMILL